MDSVLIFVHFIWLTMLYGYLCGYSNQWRCHRRPYTPAVFWKKRKTHGRMSRWGLRLPQQQKSSQNISCMLFAVTAPQIHIFILFNAIMSLFHRKKWLVPWQQWESTMSKSKSRGLKTRPIHCWWRGERKPTIRLLKTRLLLAKDTFTLSHMHTDFSWKVWLKEVMSKLKQEIFFFLDFFLIAQYL